MTMKDEKRLFQVDQKAVRYTGWGRVRMPRREGAVATLNNIQAPLFVGVCYGTEAEPVHQQSPSSQS